MIQAFAVAGQFDDKHGRFSGYAGKLFNYDAANALGIDLGTDVINGGRLPFLRVIHNLIATTAPQVVFWFPDVPNDQPKLVDDIKKNHPKCILVSSKNNDSGKYSFEELVSRALKTKSNLAVEFRKIDSKWAATIFDPLGNVFLHEETDIDEVRRVLFARAIELTGFTRIPSVQKRAERIPAPDEKLFFSLARDYATIFHRLIHGAHPERFMGNLSFRCERGFPSFKTADGLIFVSRRDVDKQNIGPDDFVAVDAGCLDVVQYYGSQKPSVDTPVQLRLYDYYPKVRYILHSHAYITGAPFTATAVSCGAIEEFDQITAVHDDKSSADFVLNLRGHGSLAFASTSAGLRDVPYEAREVPERQIVEK